MHGFRMCAGFFQQEQCHLFSREEYTVPIKWLGSMIVTAMMNGGGLWVPSAPIPQRPLSAGLPRDCAPCAAHRRSHPPPTKA